MSTSKTPKKFPYTAEDPAEVIRLFFAEQTEISIGETRTDTQASDEARTRICELVASCVADRLCTYTRDSTAGYGRSEEIEFVFKRGESSTPAVLALSSPTPLIKDLEYRFHGVRISLRFTATRLTYTNGNTIVLRASPRLVTFGGNVVWQVAAE